jgi:hypothetical protein
MSRIRILVSALANFLTSANLSTDDAYPPLNIDASHSGGNHLTNRIAAKDKWLPIVSRTLIFAVSIAVCTLTGANVIDAAEKDSPVVQPNPLNFPGQTFTQPPASDTETVEVANPTAGAAIKFRNINPTQPDFAVTGGTCQINGTLAPDHKCTILVTFKPIQAGHRQATLYVEWGTTDVVKVHLSGVASAPKTASSPG